MQADGKNIIDEAMQNSALTSIATTPQASTMMLVDDNLNSPAGDSAIAQPMTSGNDLRSFT